MRGKMVNMEKKILEEIVRIKLLSSYDMKSTLTENKNVILEIGADDVAKVVKTGEEIARIERELLQTSSKELKSALEQGTSLKKLTVTGIDGVSVYRTADEMIKALKAGKLSKAEAGKVYRMAFRNSKDVTLLKSISDITVNGKTFANKYGNLNREGFLRLVQKDLNVGPKQAEALWQANRRRLGNIGKETETLIQTGGKEIENVVQTTGKDLGQGGKTADNSINIVIDMGGGQRRVIKNGDDYIKYLDDEAEIFSRTYGKDFDDLAKQNGHENFKRWMSSDEKGAIRAVTENGKKGKGIFGKIINWGKRRLKWKILWSLAKIAGVSYAVWWLFFKKDGFTVECEEGSHFEEGKGCVPNRTGGGGGGGDTETTTDDEGNKYKECVDIYYKGCINKVGNNDIKKAQECLGVTPNGFFNQETEDALQKKINKKNFSSSDLPQICARSYGGGSFQL
jgi:hypothetical protein